MLDLKCHFVFLNSFRSSQLPNFMVILTNSFLFIAWMYLGLIGGFVFIIIQLILLIDFAHAWNETWVENMEEGNSKCWYVMLMGSTFTMFAAALTGIALLFVFFTKASDSNCSTQKFIISFHLILCVIVSVMSILPQVQERQPRSGTIKCHFSLTLIFVKLSLMNSPKLGIN